MGGEECANCGIIFRKLAAQNEPDESEAEPPLLAESYCTNCGKPMAAQATACGHCGLPPRLERKFCPACGAATDPRQVLCISCGGDLTAPQASPAPNGDKPRPAWLRPALIGGGALAFLGIILAVVLWYSRDKADSLSGPTASSTSANVRVDASFSATLKAAERGDAEAQYNLGVLYEEGKNGVAQDKKKATSWLLKAAKQGHAEAQTMLGLKYGTGQGVERDLTQMVYWYNQAATQGYAPAQVRLGELYFHGVGIPEDNKIATYWFRKAADQDNADGQYSLGLAYGTGRGVPLDTDKFYELMRKAADQGHEDAIAMMNKRSSEASDEEIERACKLYCAKQASSCEENRDVICTALKECIANRDDSETCQEAAFHCEIGEFVCSEQEKMCLNNCLNRQD